MIILAQRGDTCFGKCHELYLDATQHVSCVGSLEMMLHPNGYKEPKARLALRKARGPADSKADRPPQRKHNLSRQSSRLRLCSSKANMLNETQVSNQLLTFKPMSVCRQKRRVGCWKHRSNYISRQYNNVSGPCPAKQDNSKLVPETNSRHCSTIQRWVHCEQLQIVWGLRNRKVSAPAWAGFQLSRNQQQNSSRCYALECSCRNLQSNTDTNIKWRARLGKATKLNNNIHMNLLSVGGVASQCCIASNLYLHALLAYVECSRSQLAWIAYLALILQLA